MNFERLKETWNQLGEVDPLWAILSGSTVEDGQWDLEQFLASGRAEIACVLEEIRLLGIPLTFGKALDFGCGVGRLTQALGNHFQECHGVDIAPSMIDLANKLNDKPSRISYHLNQAEDLALFAGNTFDFIYSRIVLQHMDPAYSKKYIAEFVRLLKPGGLVAFQVPACPEARVEADIEKEIAGQLRSSGRFVASLVPAETALELQAGERRDLAVQVQNNSQTIWFAEKSPDGRPTIILGNHWLDENKCVVQFDDGRTSLPVTLQPGEMVEVSLLVTAPQKGGHYWLELDLVEEHVTWFSDKGNQGAVIPVTVSGPVEEPATEPKSSPIINPSAFLTRFLKRLENIWGQPANFKPEFEMHGILPAEVVEVIQASNGQLVAVHNDGSAGRIWRSYFYYVTK